jgi:hypothetical protein
MKKPKRSIPLIISILVIGLVYGGIILLIAKFLSLKKFDMNIPKQIIFLVLFVILLPLLETFYCNVFLSKTLNKKMKNRLKLSSGYQYTFTFISVIPAIDLSYTIIILLRNINAINATNIQYWKVSAVIILFLPYLLLNIFYRKLFIKGKFKIDYSDFLRVADGV